VPRPGDGLRWRRGRCDIALFASRTTVTANNAISLWREPYVLAAASGHLIATRDRWSVKDLADTPFVLRAACEAHEEGQRLFAAEGVRRRVGADKSVYAVSRVQTKMATLLLFAPLISRIR
jgi:hypothetical protein